MGIVSYKKLPDNYFKPGSSTRKVIHKASPRKAFCSIRKMCLKGKNRPDLEMTALARASTILRCQDRKNGVVHTRLHLKKLAKWKKLDAKRKAYKLKKKSASKKKSKKSVKKDEPKKVQA